MDNTYALTLKFPGWDQLEVEEFLETMRNSNDIEIKGHQKFTTKVAEGIPLQHSVISILTSSVIMSEVIYAWFQNRKKNDKLVKYITANNVMISENCRKGNINQKIRETLPYWR